MKSLLLAFVFLISVCVYADAQPANKRYRSHIGNGGTTYFFVPKKLSDKVGVEKFMFDMTHLSSTDIVTLNFSIILDDAVKVDTLILKNSECAIGASRVSMLYRDVLKDAYEIRTTSEFALKDICNVFENDSPLIFEMKLSNGQLVTATYKKTQWKKERQIITRIFNSILPLQ